MEFIITLIAIVVVAVVFFGLAKLLIKWFGWADLVNVISEIW